MSAEKDGRVNPMTVAWATMGILWQKPVVICAVRPERFTREFLDASDVFSLTVFENSWRKMLGYCGTVSGRQEDKVAKAGLTVAHKDGVPYFEENRMAFLCKKLCVTPWLRRISWGTAPLPTSGTAVRTVRTEQAAATICCTLPRSRMFWSRTERAGRRKGRNVQLHRAL